MKFRGLKYCKVYAFQFGVAKFLKNFRSKERKMVLLQSKQTTKIINDRIIKYKLSMFEIVNFTFSS